MLHVDNLSFVYPDGRVALSGITLTIEDGESVALMGENGAGKTTLIKHFNGLLLPTAGRVLVDGVDTRRVHSSDLARKVGLVFQNPYQQLFAQTVAEEITLGVQSASGAAPDSRELVRELLAALHLQGLERRHPLSLSEGERKRLALAAVLATNPSILVLDEPTLGQDGREKAALEALVRRVRGEGKSVIVATHDVDFACACCQRIILLSKGRILADGPVHEIARRSDLLQQAGLMSPQLLELSQRLASLGMAPVPQTCHDLAAAIIKTIKNTPQQGRPALVASPQSTGEQQMSRAGVPPVMTDASPAPGSSGGAAGLILRQPAAHGPIGNLDARGKLVAALLVLAGLTFAQHSLPLILVAAAFLIVIILDHLFASWLRIIVALLPVVVLVGIMDMIYFGAGHGLLVAGRFILTLSLFALFFMTTSLDDLSAALMSWRLPYPLVFALVTGARFAPTVALEAQEIMDAYRARGVNHGSGITGWLSRYGRILIPLVAATIRRSLRLAEAMEMRGFGKTNRPTLLRELSWHTGDALLVAIALGLFATSVLL